MTSSQPACLYQETRVNLNPARLGSTIDVFVPAHGASAFAARSSPKRRRIAPSEVNYDEDSFSRLHLASESSIHFRPHTKGKAKHEAPRVILWRVLEERKVLELQVVDLEQDHAEKAETLLTLRLAFPDPIRPTSVAFAEDDLEAAHPTLVGFVVTTVGALFTLNLRKELFVKTSGPGSIDATDWCSSSTPSAFTYRTPYRLLARSGKDLWASLSDGSLVRFEREDINGGLHSSRR